MDPLKSLMQKLEHASNNPVSQNAQNRLRKAKQERYKTEPNYQDMKEEMKRVYRVDWKCKEKIK